MVIIPKKAATACETLRESIKENFSSSDPLFQSLITQKKVLCIVNPKHEKILEGEGQIAVPIHDRNTGNVHGMLKIEEISFSELNLSTIELCEALGEIVGKAYGYSQVFQNLLRNQIYSVRDERVYSSGLYQLHQNILEKPGVLELVIQPKDNLRTTRNQLISSIQSNLKGGELLYENDKSPNHFRVLVPSSTKQREGEISRALEQGKIQHQWISS